VKLGFDAVFYYVRDLDRAVAFYEDVLGLTLRSRDVVARFDLDGVLVELVPTTDPEKLAGRGNARLCLAVDDAEQAAADLRRLGVAAGPVERRENGRLATFHDPDGNELALWQGRCATP
jgi:predicted enzyme related to lactoylglutathione lyase